MAPTTSTLRDPIGLLDPVLRDRICADVRAKYPDRFTPEQALQGVGQMAAFLTACANSQAPLSPSPVVDDFWHAFLLHTKAYREWCAASFGEMVDHQPGFLPMEEGGGKVLRQRAVDMIADLGFLVDMDFWPELDLAECSQCHQNCHDSPLHG